MQKISCFRRKNLFFIISIAFLVLIIASVYIYTTREAETRYFAYRLIDRLSDSSVTESPLLPPSQKKLESEIASIKNELNQATEKWTYLSGKWESKGGLLYELEEYSIPDEFVVALNEGGDIRNGVVKVDIKLNPSKEKHTAGVCFRMADNRKGYLVLLSSTGFVSFQRIVNGRKELIDYETLLGKMGTDKWNQVKKVLDDNKLIPYVPFPVLDNKWYTLMVTFSDNEFRVFVSGKHLLSVNDNLFSKAGKVGVVRGEGSGAYFKDLFFVDESRMVKFADLEAKEDLLSLGRSPTANEVPKVGKPSSFIRTGKIGDEYRDAILAPPATRISFPIEVSKDTFLEFSYGVLSDVYTNPMKQKGDGALFELYISKGEKTSLLFSDFIDPKNSPKERRWFDVRLDLSRYAGDKADLVFQTKGSRLADLNDERYDYAVWGAPTLYHPRKRADGINVLLISLDTLRADHLNCYGYKQNSTSPNIDNLAKQGVRFETAVAHNPWTTPSHFSIFTSLTPPFHRWLRSKTSPKRLEDSKICIAQIFEKHNYNTVAFTGGGLISAIYGFNRGFQRYYENVDTDAGFTMLMDWLDENHQKLFFAFYHTYECHAPFQRKFFVDKNHDGGRIGEYFEYDDNEKIPNPTPEEKRFVIDSYDSGIFYIDGLMGRLIEKLKDLGIFDKTLIVLLSDHGEELFDHNPIVRHGHSLYDELLLVPLIMVYPKDLPPGKIIKEQVRLIDVMPTILDIANLTINSELEGVSLLPLIEGKKGLSPLTFAYSESIVYKKEEKRSIRTKDYKYIMRPIDKMKRPKLSPDNVIEELYNLKNDSQERVNLASRDKEMSSTFLKVINNFLAKQQLPKQYESQPFLRGLTEEQKERLRALGYIK